MKKMSNQKIENIDNALGPINVPPNFKKNKHLQLPHYMAENRENIKSVSESIQLETSSIENYQANLSEVDNTKVTIYGKQEFSPLNGASTLKNKTSNTSDEELEAKTKGTTKILTPDDLIDSSKIYISCRFCKKGFETAKKFSRHDCRKKKENLKIEMHKCKFCSLTFSKRQHLDTHVQGHKRNNCNLCNAQFTKRKALCKHLRTEHNVKEPEKLYKCSFCDKHFAKKLSLNLHLKSHINNQYFCLRCCFMCDDEDAYNDHVKQHIKISKHECHLCQKKFVRRQQYDQHMTAHERYFCSSCDITFSNKKLFLKHQHSVHHTQIEKKYACRICKKLFVRPKNLEIHQRVHTGEKPVKCSHCEKHFSDDKSLLKHMTTVKHLQRVSNQNGQIIEIEKPFLCSKCGVRFHRQQSLLRHVEIIHSTSEFLKCPHCEYKSKCKTNYNRHLELHSNIKRFVCELCGSSFRALATLKEHYVFVHSENREFICNVCKKGFKNKSTLQRHMRIHSESRPYKCYCDRDYKRMSHLKRHMISAHQMTLKKNQIPTIMKEKDLSSLSEENIAELFKSEALPDESSCDDFPVSHYDTAAMPLSDLNINEESSEKQLSAETEDDSSYSVPLKSMQKLPTSRAYVIAEDPENITFHLSQYQKIQPTGILPNSETSCTSADDTTLSLSPSNYCTTSSPLNMIPIENVTNLSQDVDSITSIDNIISSPNLNFQTSTSTIESFATFSLHNSDSPNSLSIPPFLLNGNITPPSHVTDINLEQNSSQRQLFDVSEDFLSLPPYTAGNEFEVNCSPNQFFSWDTDENSNSLKISNNDLATPSTCANLFSSSLTCNVNNILPNNLFANDSFDATTLNSEFDSLPDIC